MIIRAAVDLAVLGFKDEDIITTLLEQHPEIARQHVIEILASDMFKAVVKIKKNAVKTSPNWKHKNIHTKPA
jgi:hypothetical protein